MGWDVTFSNGLGCYFFKWLGMLLFRMDWVVSDPVPCRPSSVLAPLLPCWRSPVVGWTGFSFFLLNAVWVFLSLNADRRLVLHGSPCGTMVQRADLWCTTMVFLDLRMVICRLLHHGVLHCGLDETHQHLSLTPSLVQAVRWQLAPRICGPWWWRFTQHYVSTRLDCCTSH